jgi:hypothetical protein
MGYAVKDDSFDRIAFSAEELVDFNFDTEAGFNDMGDFEEKFAFNCALTADVGADYL